jgi:hypothetical protein
MKKLLFICLLCIFSVVCAVAQEKSDSQATNKKTDFSGTWIPQVEKDSKPDAGSKGWTNVIITQVGQDIKFTLVYPQTSKAPTRELKYYIDERGETNEGLVYYYYIANGKETEKEVKSKTKWDGSVLVTVHKMVFRENAITVTNDLTMRWELSPDGKTLTRYTKLSNYVATYGQKILPMKGTTDTESKDTYFLLEAKP